jgi:hypothetical protein
MFCPKCSQPQPTDGTRFCPRCGFHVGEIRELVGKEEARAAEDARVFGGGRLPPQKDISAGALLMFAGGVASVVWGLAGARWPAEVLLPQVYFVLGLALVFVLTLFHPLLGTLERLFSGGAEAAPRAPRQRDGINLGAVLMFAGTLKAMLITSFIPPGPERGVTTLAIMAAMLFILLLLRPLLRDVHALLFKPGGRAAQSAPDTTAPLDTAPRPDALPPARAVPVNDFAPARADTGELVAPASVTEETTRRLSDL